MAKNKPNPGPEVPSAPKQLQSKSPVLACFLAWFIPGAGHMYIGQWVRGAVFFVLLSTTYLLGIAMNAMLDWNITNIIDLVTIVFQCGNGVHCLWTSLVVKPDVQRILSLNYEIGSMFTVVSGALNLLLVFNVYDAVCPQPQETETAKAVARE